MNRGYPRVFRGGSGASTGERIVGAAGLLALGMVLETRSMPIFVLGPEEVEIRGKAPLEGLRGLTPTLDIPALEGNFASLPGGFIEPSLGKGFRSGLECAVY
jgi:hypothetical protein